MRRFIKPALITLGAAAAVFTVVSSASFDAAPAAKTKVVPVCETNPEAKLVVPTTQVPINLPTLPTIPNITLPTLPCFTLPTLPPVTLPNVTIPPVTLPTVTLPTIPPITLPTIPIPVFRTTTTFDQCTTGLAQVKAGVVAC